MPAMTVNDGHIETVGMLVIELGIGIQVDHMIFVHLFQEKIGVGVLALVQENHIELILSPQNIGEKVLHREQLVLVQDHQVIIGGIGHQELVMKISQNTEDALDQDLWKISIIQVIKEMKPDMIDQNIVTEGDPGQYLWKLSIREGGHHLKVRMKIDPNTESGLGQNPLKVRTPLLRKWMKTEMKNQSVMIEGGLGQSLWKVSIVMMIK